MTKPKITIIIGPTASGKSGLAVRLAQKQNSSIVNADSMQIYSDLSIISARPTQAEMMGIPHLLYGYVDAWTQGTVQDWLNRVIPVLKELENPIVVGGTGLYLSLLINGINEIPDIDPTVRKFVRQMDLSEIKKQVIDCSFTDPQRLMRALEVQLSTGKPLAYFQKLPKKKLIDADFNIIFINPDRDILYQNCEKRFYQMIKTGGIEEIEHLLTLKPTGGVLKAIGVPEIISYIHGYISKEEMCKQAILSTKHYAKRQITWFRHQIQSDIIIKKADELIIEQ
ncbi:MAG: tRNA (adenosine(37)-N6)-dimethylallyltransferase MiaA [Alphaproteobacteria bacterium]|nr:tRNA (adenosine(37)-N6)-dimethylallyltransferase MiaA [Alphaproteobacteria bacterium]